MIDQINQENWFDSMTRNAVEGLNKLTIIKKPVKHIPIECWQEVYTGEIVPYDYSYTINGVIIRNQGGKTYILNDELKKAIEESKEV